MTPFFILTHLHSHRLNPYLVKKQGISCIRLKNVVTLQTGTLTFGAASAEPNLFELCQVVTKVMERSDINLKL